MSKRKVLHELSNEVARLSAMGEPIQREREIYALLESLRKVIPDLAAMRVHAIEEMMESYGLTRADVARELGISWIRAKQLTPSLDTFSTETEAVQP